MCVCLYLILAIVLAMAVGVDGKAYNDECYCPTGCQDGDQGGVITLFRSVFDLIRLLHISIHKSHTDTDIYK